MPSADDEQRAKMRGLCMFLSFPPTTTSVSPLRATLSTPVCRHVQSRWAIQETWHWVPLHHGDQQALMGPLSRSPRQCGCKKRTGDVLA